MTKLYAPKNADIETYFAAHFKEGDYVVRVDSGDERFANQLKGKIQEVIKLSGSKSPDQIIQTEPYKYIAATIGFSTSSNDKLFSGDDGKKLITIATNAGDKYTAGVLHDKMARERLIKESASRAVPEKTGAELAASHNSL